MLRRFFYSNTPTILDTSTYLERPHVHKLLEKAIQKPLVVVVAEAGYGKTEAVYSFLKGYNAATTWMQLSRRDNLGSRFWENYTHTIALYNESLAAKLSEHGFPETESQAAKYLTLTENEIARNARYVFVFDDFHLIEDRSVLWFIERAIYTLYTPLPNVTTILISRNEPAINTIGLFSKGLCTRINEEDLRFSGHEIWNYLQMQGIKPSRQIASDIYDRTEGWAFAVSLAGLLLKKKPIYDHYALSALELNIFKLIESEIFSGISSELQKFLVKLSLVERLSLDFVKRLSPGKNLMEEAVKASAFIRYDAYLNEYRIHHLFLEYLTRKQALLTEDEKRTVYAEAALWCFDNNYKMDTISYCEKIGDYDKIVEIVYMFQLMLPHNTALYLLEVLERIPQDAYEKNYILYLLHARFLAGLGRFGEAISEFEAIIEKFEALPSSPLSCRVLCGTYNNLGFAYYCNCMHKPNYDFGIYFEKSDGYYPLSGHTVRGPVTNLSVGSYACRVGSPEKGHLEKFVEAVAASVPHVSRTMAGCSYGLDDLVRAEVAYFKSDVKSCEKFAWQSLYKAREKGQYEIENRALFFLLRVALAAGNYGKIQELLGQLELQLDQTDYTNRSTLYDIVTGWYYVTIRQTGQVANWLKDDFDKSDINFLMHGLENIVKAKHYLLEKRYHALLAFLKSQEKEYGLGAFLFGKIGLKVVEAICRYYVREKEEAMKAFEAAYDFASPNSLDMLFIEEGNNMRTLTSSAMRSNNCAIPRQWLEKIHKKSAAYAKKLAYVISEYENDKHLGGDIHLTVKERAILTDLYQGLSRTEIAINRNLSVNTIKADLQMIYTKLGAADGADAVRIARSLGLLKLK
ncbi:MAG: LuxR C-terminal-related transcriptional regulator [Synergistaceae bacterium]|nr:LuxR C-terminal-related transcriptional regulator [Synergistaceae bacterium]